MPAVSKKQQRFFGMVRAAQKGELEDPSSEVLDVANDIDPTDAKKFAKTKHKGLPEKKKVNEMKVSKRRKDSDKGTVLKIIDAVKRGRQRHDDAIEKKKPHAPYEVVAQSYEPEGELIYEKSDAKKRSEHDDHLERSKARMKHGKVAGDPTSRIGRITYDRWKAAAAEAAEKNKLRPGEVKKLVGGKWVSNKD